MTAIETIEYSFLTLLALPANWDSYDAKRIDPRLRDVVLHTMESLLAPGTPKPTLVPCSDGGVQVEWSRNGIDVEIVFEPGERVSFYCYSHQTEEECEGVLPDDNPLLMRILKALE